jgi:transposase InsO family protein
LSISTGKREQPAVIHPQVTVPQGVVEVGSKIDSVKPNEKRESLSNIEQAKNLDKPSVNIGYEQNSQTEKQLEQSTSLNIINLTDSEYEFSDDEDQFSLQNNGNGSMNCFSEPVNLSTMSYETIQGRTQLNSTQGQDWYNTKFKLVETQTDRFTEWKINNGELFYYKPDYEKALIDDENPWKKVIKPEDVLTVLRENHDLPQAGHLGRDKTLDRIRQNYYWPGMTQDVKSYVEDCETCLKVKYNQSPIKGPLKTRPLQQPWSQLSIDTVVSQTRTKKGNSNVMVVLDLYTKYIELFPMRQRTGKNVVRALDVLFDRWGAPKSVLTDNGTEYINKEVKAFLEARGVEHLTTPLNHPQGNPVERVNRTIKPMIAAFVNDNHNEWDEHLTKIQFAYNTVPHTGSRVSPFYLNHGREAVFKNIRKPGDDTLQTFDESVERWVKRLGKIDEFRHKIESRLKTYANKTLARSKDDKQTSVEIKIGTEVYYPNKKLSNKAEGYSAKFAHRFVGPVYVKRVLGPMVVELADKTNKIIGKYYVTDLKIPRRSLRSQCVPSQDNTSVADDQQL